MSKMIKNELLSILPFALGFDVLVYIVSLFFKGLNYDMATGLLIGTALMLGNLLLLGNASESALYMFTLDGNVTRAKRKMAASYAIRSLILAAVFYASVKLGFIDTLGVMIPFLYPKPIYMIKSFISDKREGK